MVCDYGGILFRLNKRRKSCHPTAWMNLEDIRLREMSSSQKDKFCMILLDDVSKAVEHTEQKVEGWSQRAGGGGGGSQGVVHWV